MGYADNTSVPVARSRAEIEGVVTKYGATRFASGWEGNRAAINFVARDRLVRFVLPLPSMESTKVALKKTKRWQWSTPPETIVGSAMDQETRRRWRCLLLAIKSKFEIVETGIETFEQAFLANIVTEDNMTIYDRIKLAGSTIKMLAPPKDEET
jgi:hypothetical protein